MISTPKSGRGRTVVVPPHIREDLHYHLSQYVCDDPESLLSHLFGADVISPIRWSVTLWLPR